MRDWRRACPVDRRGDSSDRSMVERGGGRRRAFILFCLFGVLKGKKKKSCWGGRKVKGRRESLLVILGVGGR